MCSRDENVTQITKNLTTSQKQADGSRLSGDRVGKWKPINGETVQALAVGSHVPAKGVEFGETQLTRPGVQK